MQSKITVFHLVRDNLVRSGMIGAQKPPFQVPILAKLSVLGNLALAVLACSPVFGQATGNTTIQPDCLIPFTFTAAGHFPVTPTTGGAGDNRTKACGSWVLMYQNGTGMTGVTVTLQSGSSPTTTVTFGSFAGTISSGYTNGIVSDTGGSLQATNGTASISWVRVNVAATGTGTLNGVLYGFRNSSAAVSGGSGGTCNGLLGDVTGPCSATIVGAFHGGTQPIAFGSLGTPANGTFRFCSDCTVTSSVDNTCAGSGTGASAFRLSGAWKCVF